MAKKAKGQLNTTIFRPATTTEERENQMCLLAVDLAEQQLREGTASSQVIVHYLRLCTAKEKYELEKLKAENKLLEAKCEAIRTATENSATAEAAIKAMQLYQGRDEEEYDVDPTIF